MNSSSLNIVTAGGTGRDTVVLIHAVGLDLTYWDRQIEALTAYYRVVALDLPGHGRSARASHAGSITDLARVVASVIDDLSHTPVHVVGHSFGGMIAQELALSYPDRVRSLTLAATAAGFSDEVREYLRSQSAAVRNQGVAAALPSLPLSLSANTRQTRPDLLDRLIKTMLAMDAETYAAAWTEIANFDSSGQLGRIRCPTLVLVGEEDRNTPPDASTVLARAIPDAAMVIIPGASHMLPMEAPDRFNDELVRFLRSVGT